MRNACKSPSLAPKPHFCHPPHYHTVPYTAFFPAHCDTARASSCTHRDTVVARNGPMLIHARTTQPRPLLCCSCSGGVSLSLHSHSLALGNLRAPTTTAAAATTTTTSATLLPPIHLQHYLRGSVTSPNSLLSLLYLPQSKLSSPFSRLLECFSPRSLSLLCLCRRSKQLPSNPIPRSIILRSTITRRLFNSLTSEPSCSSFS